MLATGRPVARSGGERVPRQHQDSQGPARGGIARNGEVHQYLHVPERSLRRFAAWCGCHEVQRVHHPDRASSPLRSRIIPHLTTHTRCRPHQEARASVRDSESFQRVEREHWSVVVCAAACLLISAIGVRVRRQGRGVLHMREMPSDSRNITQTTEKEKASFFHARARQTGGLYTHDHLNWLELAFDDPSLRHASHRVQRRRLLRRGNDHPHSHVGRARRHGAPDKQELFPRHLCIPHTASSK